MSRFANDGFVVGSKLWIAMVACKWGLNAVRFCNEVRSGDDSWDVIGCGGVRGVVVVAVVGVIDWLE